MQVTTINEQERDFWDQEIAKFKFAHPLDAFGWGKVRSVDGWEPSYYLAKDNGGVAGMMMTLTKRIPFTGLSIMYAQKGPVWDSADQGRHTLRALLTKIRDDGRKKGAIFIRVAPNLPENMFQGENDPFINEGFIHLEHRWSYWNSPRDVARIDLTKACNVEDLFNTIEKDARRCVRKALNDGVIIRTADSLEELQKFYAIFSKFSAGKGFMRRAYEYQESLWNEFIVKGNGRLFLAVYKGEIIGGLICLLFGNKCLAMHMGTPYEYHKLQTYYAYVWESIKWAKEKECVWYSFRGTGTTVTQENFKRKFNPQVVSLVGYYDLPLKPKFYRLLNFCEFEVLPFVVRSIMELRKGFSLVVSKLGSEKT